MDTRSENHSSDSMLIGQHERRVRDLMARAAHPGTPPEEARTAAHLAVQIAARHGMVLVHESELSMLRDTVFGWLVATSNAHPIASKYAGRCRTCGERYARGAEVNWQRELGCWHLDCAPPPPKEARAS